MNRKQSTIKSLVDGYRDGSLSPIDIVHEALLKAEKAPSVFISTSRKRAEFEAKQADQRYRAGYPLGPLDGIPIAWKDNIDVKGSPTTGGTKVLSGHLALEDATSVRRLSQNGMISVGKTNMSELAYSGLGLNPHYGTPTAISPGHKAPGGSSSGSAVAVASGIVPVAMGSDTAGSLRVPAAFNGLYTFRPSVARHSLSGLMGLAPSMDSLGFMANTAEDVILVEETLVGSKVKELPAGCLGETSVVVDSEWLAGEEISPSVQDAFLLTIKKLRDAGVKVIERRIPSLSRFYKALREDGWLGAYEANVLYCDLLTQHSRTDFDARVYDRLLSVNAHHFKHAMSLINLRKELISRLPDELGHSLLMMPTVSRTAPDLEPLERDTELFVRVNLETLRLTMFGSYLDTPAFSLPVARDSSGQYIAIQFLAPQGQDERLLSVIKTYPTNLIDD